ncbi:MAG: tRNA (adenosine(37)-N6)-threonylcarbamoyltransferase complex ATPase subunit type 1 TsaE [Myxococcales bacterium]|nr:tRNA (adenosine(37)-N6)-threonylcarbamoyltransferase complex ATPase subunit type 1 TsaE [Myxococcales bacterium]MCB9717874.1 tRNA (adenosine(37)-N6)-threonylcarbamoyltransferase complex ATPase subunit type 1 TsaE [Myxococcales bacterium]
MELRGLAEHELAAVARALGQRLELGDVLLLRGPMGAGKTTFVRALAQGLGVRRPDRVRSPTYNLCLHHDGPRPLAHVDLFRLAEDDLGASIGSAAFEALGLTALTEAGTTPSQVLVVEWADLWAEPPDDALELELRLELDDFTRRTLVASARGPRAEARLAAWEHASERSG